MLSQAGKLWHLAVMHAKPLSALILAALACAVVAQTPATSPSPTSAPAPQPVSAPDPAKLAPSEIVAAAPASEWVTIAPEDLLVMTLANGRRVIIQLMPQPFSQGWIGNIRKLATAHWWDGLSINRVQDNYVVQWGDASEKKALPPGLIIVPERDYLVSEDVMIAAVTPKLGKKQDKLAADIIKAAEEMVGDLIDDNDPRAIEKRVKWLPDTVAIRDAYAEQVHFYRGWPLASDSVHYWPVHCYAMIGVGRNLAPDTGSGAELYTVIGHAPRHLDRNIAVAGRIISGIESLSSLPRGTGALGFYEKPAERVGIKSIRLASELAAADQPRFEYLSTESESFGRYAYARANRRDAFFNVPAGGTDICNIPVPVRKRP